MASFYASRLLRAGGGRSSITPRLAVPKQSPPSATLRAAAAFHTAPCSALLNGHGRVSSRLPKRIAHQQGILKRALVLKASMATAAPKPSSPSTVVPVAAENWVDSPPFWPVSSQSLPREVSQILRRPVDEKLIEIKPDGLIYLPEIWYRSILFEALGPGGWAMVPRGPPQIGAKVVTREWALFVRGSYVSQSIGESSYFAPEGVPRAIESAKSNALMRCCKDLGIASDLWDRRFVKKWKMTSAQEVWVEHQTLKKKAKIWVRKGDAVEYPFKAISAMGNSS